MTTFRGSVACIVKKKNNNNNNNKKVLYEIMMFDL